MEWASINKLFANVWEMGGANNVPTHETSCFRPVEFPPCSDHREAPVRFLYVLQRHDQ